MLIDAVFAPPRGPDVTEFDPGAYELQTGVIHLRFTNGADLLIEAPAKFELIDPLNARLESGNIRAMVPPTAKGFTVATKSASFENVGTEFGLRVEPGTGLETLLVFEAEMKRGK